MSHLLLVADGMGGHKAGNRASELAINYIIGCILSSQYSMSVTDKESPAKFVETLKDFLASAHKAILAESNLEKSLRGMGTTLTMAYLVWPQMWIVHAGDTRCYLLRDNSLLLLTRDHSLANQMASQGLLNPNQAERSPWSNVLWNALGAESPEVVADIYQKELQVGDRILLCSDGLNKHLDDNAILEVLSRDDSPATICEELIRKANEFGGTDNVTAIVADILPPTCIELMTYKARRTIDENAIVNRFTDYTSNSEISTSEHLEIPGSYSTYDL